MESKNKKNILLHIQKKSNEDIIELQEIENMEKEDFDSSFYKDIIQSVSKDNKTSDKNNDKKSNKDKSKDNDNDNNHNIITNRKRRKSESDLYDYKIAKRSRYDDYFKKQEKDKQITILNKEDEIYNYFNSDVPIRYKILFSNLPVGTKSLIIQKIDMFEDMSPSDSEYSKINKWLNGLSQIPFDQFVKMPVSIKDTDTVIQHFLYDSYQILKKTIYGQFEAKNKIMQILAQWISNPNSAGQIIALDGPPGVGKTSLIKNGVSIALKRPFCFYALGGASDSSALEGHSYTYEGAMWGRIVEMLMESKVMNPVIFFDELDKISNTSRGHEINGLLTHITDISQNSIYQDKYFSGVNLDLSKVIFFFSYNNIQLINPILKDRLTIIKFTGYSIEEKLNIVKDFVIPELLQNIGFQKNDIIVDSEMIRYIILRYTSTEEGVRNIKRSMEDLFLKINLLRLMKNKNDIDMKYHIENLTFPLKITKEIIDNLLASNKSDNVSQQMMFI
jgi:ATP-dependent Lon protease